MDESLGSATKIMIQTQPLSYTVGTLKVLLCGLIALKKYFCAQKKAILLIEDSYFSQKQRFEV